MADINNPYINTSPVVNAILTTLVTGERFVFDISLDILKYRDSVGIKSIASQTWVTANKLDLTGGSLIGPLILNADPSVPFGAATKNYIDNLITGLTWKSAAVVATTSNITLSGEQIIDGTLTSSSRVLVKNQTTQTQNGIYVSSSGAWIRSTDADTGSELVGATIYIETGSTNSSTQWSCSNTSITIGTTNITFVKIAGAGVYTNGTGISLTGNVFSIDSTVVTLTGSQALSNKTGNISQWTNDSNYLTSLTGVTTVNGSSGAITNIAVTTNNLSDLSSASTARTNLGLQGLAILSAAPAGTLTGTTLNATVVNSSLTSVGTIATGVWNGTIIGSTYGGTGVNNGSSTITLGGNLTTSGAFTTTFTVTGNTNVTLPTSGTLVGGTGTSGQISYWNGTNSQTGNSSLVYDSTNVFVGIGGTTPAARLHLSGNVSAPAWGTSGQGLRYQAGTYTDTTSSGTVSTTASAVHSIMAPIIAASSLTTFTGRFATLYIESPTNGPNVTLNNIVAIYAAGNIESTGKLIATDIGSTTGLSVRSGTSIRTAYTTTGLQTHTTDPLTTGTTAQWAVTQSNHSGGAQQIMLVTAGALTSQTTATSITDINLNLSGVMKVVDGTTPVMRGMLLTGRTYTPQTSALTITTAVVLDIVTSLGGTGTTFTNNYAVRADGDVNLIGGNRLIIGSNALGLNAAAGSAISFLKSNATMYTINNTNNHSWTASVLSSGTTAQFTFTQSAHTGGAQPGLLYTAGVLTNQTTATEIIDLNFNLSANLKSIDGTSPLQRSVVITGRTYTPQTSALTLTVASVLEVIQSIAGVGTTITNNYAQTWKFDTSNYMGVSISSVGLATFTSVGTGPGFAFFNPVQMVTGFNSNGNVAQALFAVASNSATSVLSTQAELLFAGATTIYSRIWSRPTTNYLPAANASYASMIIGTQSATIAGTGTHALFANMVINPITVTAGAGALTASASLYINGGATGAVTNYSLWVAGTASVRLDGSLILASIGSKLLVKQGTNASSGVATLVAGTVTVSNTLVTANTGIIVYYITLGTITIPSSIGATTKVAGTSFTIKSSSVTDTSTVGWLFVEPAP